MPDEAKPASEPRLAWLPNALTLARIALAPLIAFVMISSRMDYGADGGPDGALFSSGPMLAAALLALAGVLDWLDGKLARAMGVQSAFGQFWDPVADKLVIGAMLIGGAFVLPTMLFVFPAAVILWRDAFVTWLRMRPSPSSAVIARPLRLAQWKTAVEFVALLMLFGAAPLADAFRAPGPALELLVGGGLILVWTAAGLAMWTGWRYFKASRSA